MATPSDSSTQLVLPVVLSEVAAALGLVIGLAFGREAFVFYLAGLPVPLLLLWLAADVEAPDHRIERVTSLHLHARPAQGAAVAAEGY